jgi:hypothetical protein
MPSRVRTGVDLEGLGTAHHRRKLDRLRHGDLRQAEPERRRALGQSAEPLHIHRQTSERIAELRGVADDARRQPADGFGELRAAGRLFDDDALICHRLRDCLARRLAHLDPQLRIGSAVDAAITRRASSAMGSTDSAIASRAAPAIGSVGLGADFA